MTDQQPTSTGRRARGGGGADARRAARTSTTVKQAGFIRRTIKPYEPFSDDHLSMIEQNADTVLQETGIDFYEDEEAVRMWKDAGADVTANASDPKRPRALSTGPGALAHQDSAARICAAQPHPANSVTIGGNNTVFAPVYGPPFLRNLDEGAAMPRSRTSATSPARLHVAVAPSRRRHAVRTRRCSGAEAPPRHDLHPHQVQR